MPEGYPAGTQGPAMAATFLPWTGRGQGKDASGSCVVLEEHGTAGNSPQASRRRGHTLLCLLLPCSLLLAPPIGEPNWKLGSK